MCKPNREVNCHECKNEKYEDWAKCAGLEKDDEEQDEFRNEAIEKLNEIRQTWLDLPDYVYTKKYELALLQWLDMHIKYGKKDVKIETLVLYALHHETEDRQQPYFPFDREGG